MINGLISKAQQYLMTASAVILVLFGAYMLGGRAARRSVELKVERDEKKRIQHTVDVKNETINAVRKQGDDSVNTELIANWMRD